MSAERYAAAAKATLKHWDEGHATVMVAIGATESINFTVFKGDKLTDFKDPVARAKYAPYAVDGYCSFGPWQVFLPAHYDILSAPELANSPEPRDWAAWLLDFENCASAAYRIYVEAQGFRPWSVYGNGSYAGHLQEAFEAVRDAVPPEPTSPPEPTEQQFVYANVNAAEFRIRGWTRYQDLQEPDKAVFRYLSWAVDQP